jgi:hypothetical protein
MGPASRFEMARILPRYVGLKKGPWVGVKFASLPSHELLQIEVELRLKDSDRDRTGSDPAADVGQKIVGIVEGDAVAVR